MVNVVNKMCEVPNCFKRPSLNYPGVRPAVRCGEHKLEGMTNAFRKSTTPKSASESNDSPPRRRAKSTDGDTTDSGSDADDASPTVSQPPSASKNHAVPSPLHDVSSPSLKLQSSSGPPNPLPIRHPPSATLLFKFAAIPPLPPLIPLTPSPEHTKRAGWGSGVASQRAALATLRVAVDDFGAAEKPTAATSASGAKMAQCKDVLKKHLCQVSLMRCSSMNSH